MNGDLDIIRAFLALDEDAEIPSAGPCSFFYEFFTDTALVLFLGEGDEYHAFYCDFDQELEQVRGENIQWNLGEEKNMLYLSAIFPPEDNPFLVHFAFDRTHGMFSDFLNHLREAGDFTLHLVALQYGRLYRNRSLPLTLPDSIRKNITA